MELPQEVESLDSVAPAHRQHYVEKDGGGGGFRLDAAGIEGRLEAEFNRKLAEHESAIKANIASRRADRNATALERTAHSIAGKLATPGSLEVLLPHIRERLTVSDAGGKFEIVGKGVPTLEHLTEEFRADPRFARIIVGASPADQALHQKRVNETLGITAAPASITRAAFERLTPQQRSEHARARTKISDG
jgi:hypothetical protein